MYRNPRYSRLIAAPTRLLAGFVMLCLTPGTVPGVAADESTQPTDRAAIEAIIEDYLVTNPEVVIRAIQEFQRKQQLAQMGPVIEQYRGYLEGNDGGPVLGNPDGDITIVEFFDFRCPHCRRHYGVLKRLMAEDGNIRLLPKQYPVLDREGEEPVSRFAARLALAAHRQGKYEAVHEALILHTQPLSRATILSLAEQSGLDMQRLEEDLNRPQTDQEIERLLAIGADIGFRGTPSYIIGTEVRRGAVGLASLKEAVAAARAEKTAAKGR